MAAFSHIFGIRKSMQMYCMLLESYISEHSDYVIYPIQKQTICCTYYNKPDGPLNALEMSRAATCGHIFGLRKSMEMYCILLESCISQPSSDII